MPQQQYQRIIRMNGDTNKIHDKPYKTYELQGWWPVNGKYY
jgi:hypothetical protein